MNSTRPARRAAGLSTAFPAPHLPSELDPDVVAFDSGFASPELLPDLARFAVDALMRHRGETLQIGLGLRHLADVYREQIAA